MGPLSERAPRLFDLLVDYPQQKRLIIIGGMGSIPGVVIGSFALITLPDILRQFSDYRLLLFGFLLVVMMIARPEGFIPSQRRRLELHAEELVHTGPSESITEGGA